MNVEFHYDFGSPNAYLAHLVIPAIERRTGVAFAYVPGTCGRSPKKMDEPEVIRAALQESGLPADELIALASDPAVKKELIENTERSVSRGTFGSPTFFVGDGIFFGKDRLREVEEEIRAHRDRVRDESR